MCASCSVRSLTVSAVRLRTVSPMALQLTPGPFGEALGSHVSQHVVGSAQLGAGIQAPVLAAQPLSVDRWERANCTRPPVRASCSIDSR